MRPSLPVLGIALSAMLGGPAQAANLGEIYQLARDNDAVYAAARQALAAGQEALPQGKALLRPTIGLSGNLRRYDVSAPGSAQYDTRGYGLSLSQPLYRKQNLEGYAQARLAVVLAEQQFQQADQDLILRVAQAYFDVLLAQDNLATARAQKQAVAEQLAQARKSFEVGAATIVDTHEAQARYDLARAQEIAADSDLEVKRRTLEKLIARESPALAVLTPQARIPQPEPQDMAAWVRQAENNNLAVLVAQTALETARREVDRQRGGHYPTLDLTAGYNDSHGSSLGTQDSRSGVVGLELNLPLYQGGAVSSRVRQAVAQQEKSRYDLDSARRQSALSARQAYLGVVSGEAQVKALEQALISSEAQLRSTKLGLEVGVRTRVDVLNAQQLVYSTQRDLAAARYQTLLAGLRLKAAAGTLGVDDIHALDGLLRQDGS
ncbi:MAG TPA: TolC family outer membrane protein [Thiobacillaceae bacterium]|nr:TolC family outer membrane protein [Thiobacillaceae bacterium]HNU64788.1 TolC family outer membrane protein [Thiobacillaceae bacterium]